MLRIILLLTLCVLPFCGFCRPMACDTCFEPDTLDFVFKLHRQTRQAQIIVENRADSVVMHWQMDRHGRLLKGRYVMGSKSVAEGSRLCLNQPEPGKAISVADNETAFMISARAYRDMKLTGSLDYNGEVYEVVDSVPCGVEVPSIHVKSAASGCEMWIIDSFHLPVVWKMRNNPIEIGWEISNAATAFSPYRNRLRIAFISDPHIQDIENHAELIRPMDAQLRSTRLFNENIFAFKAALDDVKARGIRLVALPGDLTDNAQRVNVAAVKEMLDKYADEYGMRFFATVGNHDPAWAAGKADVSGDSLLYSCGYEELLAEWSRLGFMPSEEDKFWATPFSKYEYDRYSYGLACEQASLDNRSYRSASGEVVYDASYVVEPVEGLWLLSIDGGTYDSNGKSTGLGYNDVLRQKPFLVEWMKFVSAEARKRGKRLVAFCHYPAADFFNGAASLIGNRWGRDKMDLRRQPSDATRQAIAGTGVRLHFAGHMHLNNTAVSTGADSTDRLINIQVPSLGAYQPAYKILSATADSLVYEVQTVIIDSVQGLGAAASQYYAEYLKDRREGKKDRVSDFFYVRRYDTFCNLHFKNVVELRSAPRDLPAVLLDSIQDDGLITDLYRLHYAGSLALRDIPESRMKRHRALFDRAMTMQSDYGKELRTLRQVFDLFASGLPDCNFIVDLREGVVR